jgi:transposase
MGLESSRVPVEPVRTTRNGRRYFSAGHKRAVVERCLVRGASVAAVSLEHGFNANLVRRWIRLHQARLAEGTSKLVPVTVREARELVPSRRAEARSAAGQATGGPIEIELGAVKLILRGPVNAGELRVVLDILARYR